MSTDGSAGLYPAPMPSTGKAALDGADARHRAPRRTRSPEDYQVEGVGLAHVRNRLELVVVDMLREVVISMPHLCRCGLCLEDAYALSLNRLPAQYIQSGGMMLGGNKGPDVGMVRRVVSGAMGQVARRPRHE